MGAWRPGLRRHQQRQEEAPAADRQPDPVAAQPGGRGVGRGRGDAGPDRRAAGKAGRPHDPGPGPERQGRHRPPGRDPGPEQARATEPGVGRRRRPVGGPGRPPRPVPPELKRQAIAAYVGSDPDEVASVLLDVRSQRDLAAAQGYTDALLGLQQTPSTASTSSGRTPTRGQARRLGARRRPAAAGRGGGPGGHAPVRARRPGRGAPAGGGGDGPPGPASRRDPVQEGRLRGADRQPPGRVRPDPDIPARPAQRQRRRHRGQRPRGVLPADSRGAHHLGFGLRLHPIFHTYRMHRASTSGPRRARPSAGADGTVVKAGVLGGYGNATVIDHGNGLATLYGHQSRILVHEGEQVQQGEVIGLVGHTGFATGPHLHFEVRVNGTPSIPGRTCNGLAHRGLRHDRRHADRRPRGQRTARSTGCASPGSTRRLLRRPPLGDERHGHWQISPVAPVTATRRCYRPGTLVLETEMDTDEGTVRIVDCMPIARGARHRADRRRRERPGAE